jgi:hypothetical protein
MHRTCAALTVVTTLLRSSQDNSFADAIEQRCPRVNTKLAVLAVDAENDGHGSLDIRPRQDCRGRVDPLESFARISW